MENVTERFLRYVKLDTQSNEEDSVPTTPGQIVLAKILVEELKKMSKSVCEELIALTIKYFLSICY